MNDGACVFRGERGVRDTAADLSRPGISQLMWQRTAGYDFYPTVKMTVLVSLLLLVTSRLVAGRSRSRSAAATLRLNGRPISFSPDASPFQLEIDFVAQVRVPTQGHVTYRWEAGDRWWRKGSVGDFQEIDIKNRERLYTSRNAAFTPLRITELSRLVSVARNIHHLQIKKQTQRVEREQAVSCLEVHKEDEKG